MRSRHYSALVLKRKLETKMEHIVLLSQPKPRSRFGGWPSVRIKYPGGRSKPGETPFETLYREVREETGLIICEAFVRELLAARSDDGHVQYFFEADAGDCLGNLITDVGWREEESSFISCPFWAKVDGLHPQLIESHRPALLKSMVLDIAATL